MDFTREDRDVYVNLFYIGFQFFVNQFFHRLSFDLYVIIHFFSSIENQMRVMLQATDWYDIVHEECKSMSLILRSKTIIAILVFCLELFIFKPISFVSSIEIIRDKGINNVSFEYLLEEVFNRTKGFSILRFI